MLELLLHFNIKFQHSGTSRDGDVYIKNVWKGMPRDRAEGMQIGRVRRWGVITFSASSGCDCLYRWWNIAKQRDN